MGGWRRREHGPGESGIAPWRCQSPPPRSPQPPSITRVNTRAYEENAQPINGLGIQSGGVVAPRIQTRYLRGLGRFRVFVPRLRKCPRALGAQFCRNGRVGQLTGASRRRSDASFDSHLRNRTRVRNQIAAFHASGLPVSAHDTLGRMQVNAARPPTSELACLVPRAVRRQLCRKTQRSRHQATALQRQ